MTIRGTVISCDAGVISGSLLYRCIVRYGYHDVHQDVDSFETKLVKKLSYFIQYDWYQTRGSSMSIEDDGSHSNKSSSYILTVIGTISFFRMLQKAFSVDIQRIFFILILGFM